MSLKIAALLIAGATIGLAPATNSLRFESYTEAYHTAADVDKPMLVVLNPPSNEVSTGAAIDVAQLQQDPEIAELLANYVVADIDTGTEHGRKVHELFGSKALPRIVVIDSKQEWQIFRTSEPLEQSEIKAVLAKYRSGTTASSTPTYNWTQQYYPGYCPNCQRR